MGNMGTGRGSDGPLPERLISLVVDARLGPAAMHGLDKITLALAEKGHRGEASVAGEEDQRDSFGHLWACYACHICWGGG